MKTTKYYKMNKEKQFLKKQKQNIINMKIIIDLNCLIIILQNFSL